MSVQFEVWVGAYLSIQESVEVRIVWMHGGRFSMAADGSIQVSLGLSTCTVEIDRG